MYVVTVRRQGEGVVGDQPLEDLPHGKAFTEGNRQETCHRPTRNGYSEAVVFVQRIHGRSVYRLRMRLVPVLPRGYLSINRAR